MDIKFGTDGWRGVMAREFTFDNVRRVAQAIAEYLNDTPKGRRLPVVIGYDHRFQSGDFAREIAQVIAGNGFRTVLTAEPVPTPAITFLSDKMKAVGIVVTASHNPPNFNGVKIKIEGRAAGEDVTAGVESFIDRSNPVRNAAAKFTIKSFRKDYLAYLKKKTNPGKFMGRVKRPVVVDYLFGASSGLLGELLGSKRIIEIHSAHDPLFGGLHPEPIEENLSALKERVLAEKALIGIALDGDGDRVAIVDDQGRYMTPCQVFPILLEYLITRRGLKGKIVQSVSMGLLSSKVAAAHKLEFEEMPVGFKHVAEAVASKKAAMAGEESGGYTWKGLLPERDGLITGLLFLEICALTQKTPSELWADIEAKYGKSDFKRVDFRLHRAAVDKAAFTAKVRKRLPKKVAGMAIKSVLDFDGVKVILEGDSWVLLRPSGTEPLIRTYAETDSPKKTQLLLETAARWVNTHL